MRKLPIILTLLLTVAWAYTCWYWYTCNIKGFCDDSTSYIVEQTGSNQNNTAQKSTEPTEKDMTKELVEENKEESIVLEETKTSPKLSAEDVLFDPLPKEIEQEDAEKQSEEDKDDISQGVSTQSGTTVEIEQEEDEIKEKTESEDEKNEENQEINICNNPLVGPISLGGNNDTKEVNKLEDFLAGRGEEVSKDGIYSAIELEAVKRFQLEYKEDVLDPWDITAPTGYVGKTSVAKINEIACK